MSRVKELSENLPLYAALEAQANRTISEMALIEFNDDVEELVALGMDENEANRFVKAITRKVFGIL